MLTAHWRHHGGEPGSGRCTASAGFGTTMIGEAVDYAIYLFVQRPATPQQHACSGARSGWPADLDRGFLALLGSGFPAWRNSGLYSTVGLVAAVLVTRFVLPRSCHSTCSAGPAAHRRPAAGPAAAGTRLRWLLLALMLGMLLVVACIRTASGTAASPRSIR